MGIHRIKDWAEEPGSKLKNLARHPTAGAVIVLSILWLGFFWRVITPVAADRVVFLSGDFYSQYLASASIQSDRWWSGQLPLWNPYDAAGMPLGGAPEIGTWYPIRWVSIWLAGPGGYTASTLQVEVALRYWLVSLMTYAWLRQFVRKSIAALGGSLIFTYGGYLTGYPMPQVSVLDAAMSRLRISFVVLLHV